MVRAGRRRLLIAVALAAVVVVIIFALAVFFASRPVHSNLSALLDARLYETVGPHSTIYTVIVSGKLTNAGDGAGTAYVYLFIMDSRGFSMEDTLQFNNVLPGQTIDVFEEYQNWPALFDGIAIRHATITLDYHVGTQV